MVALKGVLVAGGELFHGDAASAEIAAIVDADTGRLVGDGVERDLQFDAAGGPEELHALMRHHLRAAGEDALARWVIQDRRRQRIDAEGRI